MAEQNLTMNIAVNGVAKAEQAMAKTQRAVKELSDADQEAFRKYLRSAQGATERAVEFYRIREKEARLATQVRSRLGANANRVMGVDADERAFREFVAGQKQDSLFGALKGAGIVIGANALATTMRASAAAAREWATGAISAQQAILKAAESVPVLGKLVATTRELASAFDRVGIAAQKADEERKKANDRFRERERERQAQDVRDADEERAVQRIRDERTKAEGSTRNQLIGAMNDRVRAIEAQADELRKRQVEEFGSSDRSFAEAMAQQQPSTYGRERLLERFDARDARIRALESEAQRAGLRGWGDVAAFDRQSREREQSAMGRLRGWAQSLPGQAADMARQGVGAVATRFRELQDRERRAQDDLLNITIQRLRQGDEQNRQEAERLEILRQVREEEELLTSIIKDRSLSDDVRRRALEARNALPGERDRLLQAMRQDAQSPLIPFAPGGYSIARAAAIERAAVSEIRPAERQMIDLLTSIDTRLTDDSFR